MEQARTVEHFKVKHNRITGLIYAIISSASFGMIPMFTVPAIKAGMDNSSIIFYRFAFSTLLFSLLILCKRPDMRIREKAILPLLILTLFYAFCSLFLLTSYSYMPTGVATTIHFLYPVFVTVLMVTFFKEMLSLKLIASVVLAISGVALLSLNGGGGAISMKGVAIVLVTVFCYGSYIVGVNKTKVKEMDSMAVTFYVLLLTTVFCIANIAISGHTLQAIPDMHIGLNLVMLGFIPTLVSNLCLVLGQTKHQPNKRHRRKKIFKTKLIYLQTYYERIKDEQDRPIRIYYNSPRLQ